MFTRSSDKKDGGWGTRDPLSSVLLDLRLEGTFFCQANLREPWAMDVPERDFVSFHFVSEGRCALLRGKRAPPLELGRGDLVLVPGALAHRLSSGRNAAGVAIDALPQRPLSPLASIVRHGGRGPRALLVCGGVRFEAPAAKLLLAQMPELVVLRAAEASPVVAGALAAMEEESRTARPGGVTLMTRLADVVIVHALRGWLERARPGGWLAALDDPQIGRAVAAVHEHPERAWTIAALAREAHLSRSRFSQRFAELVGEAPMQYVTRVKMQRAQERLRAERLTVEELADAFGYASGPAFARAFKRHVGVPPGRVSRARRDTRRPRPAARPRRARA